MNARKILQVFMFQVLEELVFINNLGFRHCILTDLSVLIFPNLTWSFHLDIFFLLKLLLKCDPASLQKNGGSCSSTLCNDSCCLGCRVPSILASP